MLLKAGQTFKCPNKICWLLNCLEKPILVFYCQKLDTAIPKEIQEAKFETSNILVFDSSHILSSKHVTHFLSKLIQTVQWNYNNGKLFSWELTFSLSL